MSVRVCVPLPVSNVDVTGLLIGKLVVGGRSGKKSDFVAVWAG